MENYWMGIKSVLLIMAMAIVVLAFWGLLFSYGFPFFDQFSKNSRLQRFVDKGCLDGNEVAIKIKKRGLYRFRDDGELVKEAINGNEFAYKALRLDQYDIMDKN